MHRQEEEERRNEPCCKKERMSREDCFKAEEKEWRYGTFETTLREEQVPPGNCSNERLSRQG
jgi:hypothetical protein